MLQPKGFNWLGLALLMLVIWSGLASSAEAKRQKFTVKYSDGTTEEYSYDDSSCRLIGWQRKVGLNFSLKMMKTYQGSFGFTSETIKELDDLEKDFGLQYEALCKDYQIGVYKGREKLYDCRRGNVSNALSGLRAIKIALAPVKDATTAEKLKADVTDMVKGILKLVADGFKGDCIGQHLALGTGILELAPGEMERTVPIKNVGVYDINWWTENDSSRLILDPSAGGRLTAGNATKLSVYRSPMNGGGAVEVKFHIRDDLKEIATCTVRLLAGQPPASTLLGKVGPQAITASLATVNSLAADASPSVKGLLAAELLILNHNNKESWDVLFDVRDNDAKLSRTPEFLLAWGVAAYRIGNDELALQAFDDANKGPYSTLAAGYTAYLLKAEGRHSDAQPYLTYFESDHKVAQDSWIKGTLSSAFAPR